MLTPRQPNRLTPKLLAASMMTYALAAPLPSHWRPATCAEVDCPNHVGGWRTVVDEASELGQAQAAYVRRESGRRYREYRDPAGLTVFTFEPGQECFATHRQPLEREPLFLVKGGDWRGNPRGTPTRQHTRGDLWVEDFAEHQQALADRLERG